MKWKQTGCKQANREMGKFDYNLWYGRSEDDYYQVQGLHRFRPVKKRSQANSRGENGGCLSSETLCFGSIKAARRFVLKHRDWLIEDYKRRNAGRRLRLVKILSWRSVRKDNVTIKL